MSLNDPRLRRGAIAVIVLLAVAAALLVSSRPPEVRTVSLTQRDVVEVLAVVGRVRAPSTAGLGVSIAGTVREVRVREGDRVEQRQTLLVLEDREAAALVRQAEAALAETRASTVQSIAEAEREAELATRDRDRIRVIVLEGGLTQQRLEQAEQRAEDAVSRLEALRVEAAVGEPASVGRARATLEAARARLALTRVTAPAAGVLLTRSVEPGDAVAPGRVLLELASDGPVELVVYPGEENLGVLRVGKPATASADAFPDRPFEANVTLVAPSVDPSQGTVEVRLAVPRPPPFLRPAMTVSVNIETGREAGAWVLPEEAVQDLAGQEPWVAVVGGGRLERRPVRIGARAEGFVQIVSGLEPDASVVSTLDALEPGDRVRVQDLGGG